MRAIKIQEKAFGSDHPSLAHSLGNRATVLEAEVQRRNGWDLFLFAFRHRCVWGSVPGTLVVHLCGVYLRIRRSIGINNSGGGTERLLYYRCCA